MKESFTESFATSPKCALYLWFTKSYYIANVH